MLDPSITAAVARALLAGGLEAGRMAALAAQALGRPWNWLGPLAQRYVKFASERTRPRFADVQEFLKADAGFRRACGRHRRSLWVEHWIAGPQPMLPVQAAQGWAVPEITTIGDLTAWLELTPGELDWFADLMGLNGRSGSERLSHYRYRVLAKNFGSVRLIEAPKPRLKQLQQRVLAGILAAIPPHPAAHGFRKGHSIRSFAAPHAGRRVVLRMDLQDFFPSVCAARVQALFRTAGYPEATADLLGGLCSNAAPRRAWDTAPRDLDPQVLWHARKLYQRPHLPQGAPTSPALANLCAYRADCRLTGLARSVGAQYTRYADDLAFSGGEDLEACVDRFAVSAAAILAEEGFQVHHRKTRVMRQGVRQYLAGLVTNAGLNVVRADFDRLKATLTNCVRRGPADQNREAHPRFREHLEGRVAWVESVNPEKGRRLRAILERIAW